MKIVWILLASTFISSVSFAKSDDTTNSKFIYRGWEYYLTYFFAGPMTFSDSGFDVTLTNLTFNKYYLPDVGIRYDYIRNDGYGVTIGGKYLFNRSLEHAKISSGGASASGSLSGFSASFALAEANITYSSGEAYFFLGPNYSIPILKNANGTSATGNVGWQIGLGWDWGDHISNIDFGKGRVNFEIYAQGVDFQFNNFLTTSSGSSSVNWFGGGFKIGVNY